MLFQKKKKNYDTTKMKIFTTNLKKSRQTLCDRITSLYKHCTHKKVNPKKNCQYKQLNTMSWKIFFHDRISNRRITFLNKQFVFLHLKYVFWNEIELTNPSLGMQL